MRLGRTRARAALALALGAGGWLGVAVARREAAHACPQPAAAGTQPCDPALRSIFLRAAAGALGSDGFAPRQISVGTGEGRHFEPGRVPCVILSAVAQTESNWRQFNASCGNRGSTLVSGDCGYGIGQITSGMDGSGGFSPARVAADPAYNVSVSVNILIQKWLIAPAMAPNDPDLAENWYFALWGYNGFAAINNPNRHPNTRGTYYNPGAPAYPRSNYPYQAVVYGYALYPTRGGDGQPRWPSTRITQPNFSEICASCGLPSTSRVYSAVTPTHAGRCASDYGAEFVRQSFPAAPAGALRIRPGANATAWIEMRNTGLRPWDGNTRLATTEPRERASVFANPAWPAAGRLASVRGTVAPGATHRFEFVLRAPNEPGTFTERFGLVQDGVAWFGDPTQGGPADNELVAQIDVREADWAATPVAQSFPDATQGEAIVVAPGDSVPVWFELRNTGSAAWDERTHLATSEPRERVSPFAAPSWVSPARPARVVARTVAPGATHRFEFTLQAPTEPGVYNEYFNLVQDGVAWFSDPGQGGPRDNALQARVIVAAPGLDAGTGRDGAAGDGGRRLPDGALVNDGVTGSCSCRTPGHSRAGGRAGALGTALALAAFATRAGRGRRR